MNISNESFLWVLEDNYAKKTLFTWIIYT